MKRLAISGTLACLLVSVAVAAPALSLSPYRPDPVEFSISATGGAKVLAAAAGGRTVSRPLRAPKRFNMVGLTWRGGTREPTVRIRTREQGGRWSRWTTLAAHAEDSPDPHSRERIGRGTTAPTWAGEADWIQYKSSRPLPGARLHFLNLRGTATRTDRARTTLRRATNSAVLSLAGIASTPKATAADGEPAMVSRDGWGAAKCKPRTKPIYGEVDAAFIHHTVNANDYSRSEAPDVVLGICLFHRDSNGWNDIGYNFLVDRFGTIYEGRGGGTDKPVIGAQAQGYNAQSTGIANLGTFTSVKQTPAALSAIARLIRWKLPISGAPTFGPVTLTSAGGPTNRFPAGRKVHLQRVIGHRDTGATSCPGNALYAQLPALRKLVGQHAPSVNTALVDASAAKGANHVRYGRSARIDGTVTNGLGDPLGGIGLSLDARVGHRWRPIGAATTDSKGAFVAKVKIKRTRLVRARFAGSATVPPAGSRFTLGIAPAVILSTPATAAGAGGRVPVRGRVTPRKRSVYQVLQERRGGRWRTVGVKPLKVSRKGAFRGSFIPASRATYRYYVSTKSDKVTVRGISKRYALAVGRRRGGGVTAPR